MVAVDKYLDGTVSPPQPISRTRYVPLVHAGADVFEEQWPIFLGGGLFFLYLFILFIYLFLIFFNFFIFYIYIFLLLQIQSYSHHRPEVFPWDPYVIERVIHWT